MSAEALVGTDDLASKLEATFSIILCLYSNTNFGVGGRWTRVHLIIFNNRMAYMWSTTHDVV